ncbi:hypothetical protein DSCA_42650 [Desulfosarcina alkanivorans]|uniref:EBNA-1 nuclear protein n=1 Tax=Desulfosarcina alkanivorans TaxID=571177 RepID=A0A5K7YPR2_9BACT|nr:DUF1611 domain-containing protein [Desulfosarcina alkanivorans]BBO70335.1 hypothetical protein DSCA_42650 [Desulfosarcina alkanivorans]
MKPEGKAIVYCEGAFNTLNGKTAHGLVRFCRRYHVVAVVDSRYAGRDAGEVIDGQTSGTPVLGSIDAAMQVAEKTGLPATHLVIGIAPDGGRLGEKARQDVIAAIARKLNIDCGLHDFLSEDEELRRLAASHGVVLRDIRKPPDRSQLHFFSGKIEAVEALKIAVLGTDSAVGKRTTAWLMVQAFERLGYRTEMIGTGQTAWMQGARYSMIMDSLVNDFVSGEIEHAVWQAWNEQHPDVIIIEGQGSLMNPAYPGGFEILAAGRPDLVVLQHAPARKDYDGFPGYPIQPLSRQIQAVESLSGKPVVAITINHEGIVADRVPATCEAIEMVVGLPAFDVLRDQGDRLVATLLPHVKRKQPPDSIKPGADGAPR